MTFYAKPNIRLDVGGTDREKYFISTNTEYGVDGNYGIARITLSNPEGVLTSLISEYDEVKLYSYYDDQSETQIYGGHVEGITYERTGNGDTMTILVKPYEYLFTFADMNHAFVFEYVPTIASTSTPGILYEVNANLSVATDFTTNFPSTVGNVDDDNADIDRSVPIWSTYNAAVPHHVGQTFRPTTPYISNVVVKASSIGSPQSLKCGLYEWDTDWDTTVAGTLLGGGLILSKEMRPFIYGFQPNEDDDSVDIVDQANDQVNTEYVGQTYRCETGRIQHVWVKAKRGAGVSVDELDCRIYKAKDAGGNFEETPANVDWNNTCAGIEIASSSLDATEIGTSYSWVRFSIRNADLKIGGLYLIAFCNKEDYTDGDWYLRKYTASDEYAGGDLFEDGARVAGDDLLFYVSEYDPMTPISIAIRADNLDTTKDHLLAFYTAGPPVGSITDGYFLQIDTDGGYAGGQLYEDEVAITGKDLWFKINAFETRYEDKNAFEAMTDLWGRMKYDWYSDYSQVIQTVHRTSGSSVATFTMGKTPVLGGTVSRSIENVRNWITIAGEEATIFIPDDKDQWTEPQGGFIPPWNKWSSDDETNCPQSFASTNVGLKQGNFCLQIDRTGHVDDAYYIYFPGDGVSPGGGAGSFPSNTITRDSHTLAFWCTAKHEDDTIGILKFQMQINVRSVDGNDYTLYRTVSVTAANLNAGSDMPKYAEFLSFPLPRPGAANGWATSTGGRHAADWNEYDWTKVNYIAFRLLDEDLDDFVDIVALYIDGLHFVGSRGATITLLNITSSGNYDKREMVKRDRNLDSKADVTTLASAFLDKYGDGSHTWTGTPGDTRDIQQEATLIVVGRNDIKPTDQITLVYANANINQLYRVLKVRHSINKTNGWITTYVLNKLTTSMSLGNLLSQIAKTLNTTQKTSISGNARASVNLSGRTGQSV